MIFKDVLFFLLWIPAALLFFLFVRRKIGKEAVLKFSSLELVQKARAKSPAFSRFFRGLVRFLTLLFLVLALARPQMGTGEQKTTEHVVDIMLVLDISGSMAMPDFHPDNRLMAAKLEAKRFIEGRRHDRIGLVVFAGQSFTVSPLTTDHRALLTLLDQIRLGMTEDGTAIGVGLANAVNRLKDSDAKSKVAILLTDGVNNAGEIDPLTAAELARQFKVKVYTIGVGKEGTAILPIQDPRFGTRLLKVETQIDEKTLARIAAKTGGAYFRAQDESALREIFRQIDRLEKTEITVEQYLYYEERYFWFLWPALYLLLFEIVWVNLVRVKIP